MKRKLNSMMILLALLSPDISQAGEITGITGAGASFPYPLYAKWAESYRNVAGVGVSYQSVGSGEGIKQILSKSVDFGASDMPLKPEVLDKAGLMQFPTIIGGVVPVVNVEWIPAGGLRLDGPVLADIFLGKVTKWNDPAIVALNPTLTLPDQGITVVHRLDGSGTTFIFTNYLSKVSPFWKVAVGEGTTVSWKSGQMCGQGNEGVADWVRRSKGSIGYVEYAYALKNKMNTVQMKNREGQFVRADDSSFKAAAADAQWDKAPGFYKILTNEAGKATWPISGASFVLMHKVQERPLTGTEVLRFFNWGYQNGDAIAAKLDYVPLPGNVISLIQAAWKTQIKGSDGETLWR